jgi:hypothetical protein
MRVRYALLGLAATRAWIPSAAVLTSRDGPTVQPSGSSFSVSYLGGTGGESASSSGGGYGYPGYLAY